MRRLFAPVTLIALRSSSPDPPPPDDQRRRGWDHLRDHRDTPYGAAQLAAFPRLVSAVNDDPDVRLTLHLGDIKDGASRCSDAYFDQMRANLDSLRIRSS